MRSLGVTPDFVIYHKYEQQPGQEDDSTLLQAARSWVSDAADSVRQLNDYLGAQAANVEIVATENNSVSSSPGKQTTSLVNGLYYADSIGQVLQTEFNAFTWWIFRNGRETNNNNSDLLYGWRQYGDYGMVSGNNEPYPAFYASKLLSNYLAAGGDQVVSATSDYSLLSAYAVKRASGELSLMIINKSRTSSLDASISLTGIVPRPNATIYSYGVPQDEAARTGTGSPDIATSLFAGAASSFNFTFPPYSATVISLAASGGNANCSFSVEAQFGKFKSPGGSGNLTVTSDAQCAWQASSNENWITITAGEAGIGNGVVSIAVAPNTTGLKRKGRM